MKPNWKDYFYIQNNDRTSIVIILLLIVICGGTAIGFKSYLTEKNALLQYEALAEFDRFQNEMTDIGSGENDETFSDTYNDVEVSSKQKKSKDVQPAKLKEGETIDVNKASLSSLKRIPGIGESYAQRILEYRTSLGGFSGVEQLKEIKGFSGKRYTNMLSYIHIGQPVKKISINKCSKDILQRHPYLNEKQIDLIMDLRTQNKHIKGFDDLSGKQIFTPRDQDRLTPYLLFD